MAPGTPAAGSGLPQSHCWFQPKTLSEKATGASQKPPFMARRFANRLGINEWKGRNARLHCSAGMRHHGGINEKIGLTFFACGGACCRAVESCVTDLSTR